MLPELLTIPEAARLLRINEARCYELAREGRIPAVRLGRQVRIDRERLVEFIRTGGAALPAGWRREG